eukprot:TRINITY_DN1013_c0_g1_i1.p1 TRINITY_DN1013_c0_g1~~TRINITY_DN1013_c0_g1_i1.p1  ORF type:complete len:108 (-),score=12.25 TRINITY_DN1013_c0_g1_i1:78-365(-)
MFDTSGGRAFPFTLGAGEVIKGWDQGVKGMKVGGKRRIFVPSHLGYGARKNGDIPPHSALIFDVELLQIGTGERQKLRKNRAKARQLKRQGSPDL